jgi:segregation and condensation protein B
VTPETTRNIEAILMVAEEPVASGLLAQVLEEPVAEVTAALHELASRYESRGHGFVLREIAGGWRFYSHPDAAPYVERFVLEAENPRLSRAALETLAIVAYRQPVSRAQITEVRGVNCDAVIRTLALRGLIEPVGVDEGPGQAALYGTTQAFLERMGLRSLDDLPPLADFVPEAETAAHYDEVLSAPQETADSDIAVRVRSKLAEARAAIARQDGGDTDDIAASGDTVQE